MVEIMVPAPGTALRCKNGHMNSWDPRVIATADGRRAKVTALRCAVCGQTIRLAKPSFLEIFGKRTDRKTGVTLLQKPGSEHDGASER